MIEEWRQWLYPLGVLPAFFFAARYLIQWLASEKKGKSIVMPLFWKLSISGNLLLVLHSLIQQQFHVCIVQGCNCVIAWRNLNLMQPREQHLSFSTVVMMLVSACVMAVGSFILFSYFFSLPLQWFRLPMSPQEHINDVWHLLGFLGLVMFNGRFWIQWLGAERHKHSYLGAEFWWMSVLGSVLCLVYFATIGDFVNTIGPLFGLVPSIRNLILVRRSGAVGVNESS